MKGIDYCVRRSRTGKRHFPDGSLKERTTQGDSSASMQLELTDIKQDGFAQMGAGVPASNVETPPLLIENQTPLPIVDTTQIAEPFISAPDLALAWCSSTPENLEFSENFVRPTETVNVAG